MKKKVYVKDLGQNRPYKEIWDLQESLLHDNVRIKFEKSQASKENSDPANKNEATRKAGDAPQTKNHFLLVEHNPVFTIGKNGEITHVLINEEEREKKGIELYRVNRGGDITFHGPGQIVGYPIIDLDTFKPDLGWYLRNLEEVIILTLMEYGVTAGRSPGETGVWLDHGISGKERKICAMGVRCSRWITMHGFALNVNTPLHYFNYIIPCGIQNKQVTSLQKEVGYEVPMEEVKQKVKKNFQVVFDVEIIEQS